MNKNPIDIQLEAQLRKYAENKKAMKVIEDNMLDDFSESEEESITISHSIDNDVLEIEEEDE